MLLTAGLSQDPFLVALDHAPRQGVLRMADVIPPAGHNEYASNFYQRTGCRMNVVLRFVWATLFGVLSI
ncbi:hypothetical protein [Vreelandella populi]|uniref:Uncharacterized protein n=1 Tax=Vreelandella populi TaxID=2498858 RepID=A0A433LH88_9GAMM|nr:hypothetical protein [Halomonas populi]RUR40909.1 hypothetical protein ELY25_04410 [Halomonas populi]RUR49420.1 hypothetical protein ELY37_01610 [Halomonas populi]